MIVGCIYDKKTDKICFPFFLGTFSDTSKSASYDRFTSLQPLPKIGHFSTLVKILFFYNIGSFFSPFLRKANLR